MTTIFDEDVACAVCGAKQTVQEMGSTSSFGPMDPDTRPPPLQRGTMEMWVHECTRRALSLRYSPPKTRSEHRDASLLLRDSPLLVTVFGIDTGRSTPRARNGLRYHQFVAKLLAFQRELVLARDVGGHTVADLVRRRLRQASEQNFTSSQSFAHFFRQVIGRPHAAQGFEGSDCLLPLNGGVPTVMPYCSAVAAG